MNEYTYSLDDTKKNGVDRLKLWNEIVMAMSSPALQNILLIETGFIIVFESALSTNNKETLDSIVATHEAENKNSIGVVELEGPKTEDNRPLMADNRIPPGYSLYVAGQSDNVSTGVAGAGDELKFDKDNDEKTFQMLKHWYAVGARAIWEGCDMDNYFQAYLHAPATVGANQAGDFNKVATGLGFNLFVPVAQGTGAWDLDLTEKLPNTDILKCVPVPVAGNTGFFDYDSEANTLSINASQEGGYNLYDIGLDLHAFGRKVWGRKGDGSQSSLDVSGLVGKMLFNFWQLKFTFALSGGLLQPDQKAAILLIAGAKGNV